MNNMNNTEKLDFVREKLSELVERLELLSFVNDKSLVDFDDSRVSLDARDNGVECGLLSQYEDELYVVDSSVLNLELDALYRQFYDM